MSTAIRIPFPNPSEHAAYMTNYIRHVKRGTIDEVLNADREGLRELFSVLDNEKAAYRYAPDKWTVKQALIHCIDTERIFAGRALMIARGDEGKLPGYNHEAYATETANDPRGMREIEEEWDILRKSTILLFKSFDRDSIARIGNANSNPLSPRAAAYIISGHALHHLEVLRTKYGLNF